MRKILLSTVAAALLFGQAVAGDQKVKLDLFWSSVPEQQQYIYNLLLVLDTIKMRLGDRIEIDNYCIATQNGGKWVSATGSGDIEECRRIAVMQKKYPGKALNYLNARIFHSWADGWKAASAFAGVKPEELDKAVKNESDAALKESSDYGQKIKMNRPGIAINGVPYVAKLDYMQIFGAINAALPKAQRVSIPALEVAKKGSKARLWVIEGKTNGKEDKDMTGGIKRMFGDAISAENLTYDSDKYKTRFSSVTLTVLPSYIIESTPSTDATLKDALANNMVRKEGSYYVVNESGREGAYINKPLKPKTLDLYVMAQCPFCKMVEESLYDALNQNLIPEDIKINVRYIVTKTPDGYQSLHGDAEWEEDIRQLLIQKKYPAKVFWKYLLTRNKTPTSSLWEKAAVEAGVNPEDIKASFDTEGKALLDAEAAASLEYGMTASPSFVWEGQTFGAGIQGIKALPGFEKIVVKEPNSAQK